MNSVVSPAVITHSLSDHFPTIVHLKFKTKRKDENRPLIRIIKPHLIENFVKDINSKLQSLEAPNFEKLTNVFADIVNKHFPKTKLSRKQFNFAKKKTWITQKILKSIKKQNKLFAKYQKTRSDADLKTYKSFKNKLTHQKKTAKAMFFQKEIGKIKNISSTWKTISKILRKGKHNFSSLPSQLNVNRIPLTNPSSICSELNQYFCNIGHEMAKSIDKSSIKAKSQSFYGKLVSHSIYFEPTNDEEIVNIIKDLNPNKAPGYDDLSTKLIKAAAHSLSPFLSSISNSCLKSGHCPDGLKIARVTFLHKGDSKSKMNNITVLYQSSLFSTKYLKQLSSIDF